MEKPAPTVDASELLEFMLRLGQAYLAAGEQTAKVELTLRRMASAHRVRRSRAVVFPTAIFLSIMDGDVERTTFTEGPTQTLRLDQIAEVYRLGEVAARGAIAPKDGLERLGAILKSKPRFGIFGSVFGNGILAAGVAMLLGSTWFNLASAVVLGLAVGAVKMLNRRRDVLAVPFPVVAAGLVSTLVFLAVQQGFPVDPLHTMVPPLVSFLPGAMLTMGMVELAYGDMVSGSSRLVTGFIQLLLLAFGLAAGAIIVGYRPENLVDAEVVDPEVTPWIRWAGVVVFGIGAYLHFSAPKNSFLWMLLSLLVAFAAQEWASEFVGPSASGFFGMLAVTPLAYLIQLRFHGPPAMVTSLPSFWLMVPGAFSLVSVKTMLSDRMAGLDGMTTAVFVFASIAMGTLLGASVYKWATETFGWWQLQIGRVGRYFRPQR